MPKDDLIQGPIISKFFDPVINAPDLPTLRAWLREQPADEIEVFLKFFKFTHLEDRRTILEQELERRAQQVAQRNVWVERVISFILGVVATVVSQSLVSLMRS